MIRKYILLILLFIGFESIGQSIATAIYHDKEYDIRKDVIVSKITTNTTYYRKNEVEKKRKITIFNNKNRVLSELRYDENGKLIARLNYKYDTTHIKSLSRKFETWNRVIGHSSETADYIYDNNGYLIKVIDKNKSDQVFRISTIKNDEKGNPIQLTLELTNSNFSGFETANYDYEKNIVEISVINQEREIISTTDMRINFEERTFDDLIYNELGDLIKSKNKEYSYKYDKNNNWVRKTNYEMKNGRKRKYQTITRKIKYKD